jgi:hypothetical protein
MGTPGGVTGLQNLGSEIGALSEMPESLIDGEKKRVLKRSRLRETSTGERELRYGDSGDGKEGSELRIEDFIDELDEKECSERLERVDEEEICRR